MRLRIQHRLFLTLLAASGLAVVSMFVIFQWSISQGFLHYINTVENERLLKLTDGLQDAFAASRGWGFLGPDPEAWLRRHLRRLPEDDAGQRDLPPPPPGLPAMDRPPPPPGQAFHCPPRRMERSFEARLVLLDQSRKPILGPGQGLSVSPHLLPLKVDGQVIGYLGLLPKQRLSDTRQLRFLKQQKIALALVAAVILLISALLSLLLAGRLLRPINALVSAARRLTGGDFSARVEVTSADELGQLARDFNTLALTLEKNERSRRQWVADISHELRTPLAVLRGEIEALLDGVRPASEEAIRSLHAEALRLGRLVDDLYHLSLSDIGGLTYRKEPLDPLEVLRQALDALAAELDQRQIALSLDLPGLAGCQVLADPQRLHQLFANLIENSCKYTDRGGRLMIGTEGRGGVILFHFQDSAPGVPGQDMERLFERLYRVEVSRSRDLGGAGLGLAICRNIAEAHGGLISAKPSPLGGLWITVQLPTL